MVDDPLEAGDPFLDVNGDGKWEGGEPFIDLDGDRQYSAPRDGMWQQMWPTAAGGNGTLAEPISFDYTNGHAEPLNAAIAAALNKTILGGVRNLESQGRQLFARHLYCLMMLLADDNYVAPWDENDPQLMTWMDTEKKKLTGANPAISAAEADLIVKRKATCKMIAQWAVNCVDMRDPDVIMTPFEYDENPWDGWGVWNDVWTGDVTSQSLATRTAEFDTKPTFIPLDGDAATDENLAEVIDWTIVPKGPGPNTKKLTALKDSAGNSIVSHPLNQTRGVVWGAERPELLITETVAFHDRRTEDLSSADSDGHGEMRHYDKSRPAGSRDPASPNSPYNDPDPDQGLRPRGSLFVEVYNPWSPDGQYPSELYSRVNSSVAAIAANRLVKSEGVQLDRVSNFAADSNGKLTLLPTDAANDIKRSPVWRMIVVEEWPDARNSDPLDEQRTDRKVKPNSEPKAYENMAVKVKNWVPSAADPMPPFRPTDPDFDAAFDAGFLPSQTGIGKNIFNVQYPYVEREFYFTTDKSPALPPVKLSTAKDQTPDYDYSDNSFKLRIPYRTVDIRYPSAGLNFKPGYVQRFIPEQLETDATIPATQPVIAPIMPGRYGVIGSAGTKYTVADQTYTTTVGRFDLGTTDWNTNDSMHNPTETRRIELRPGPDPNKQQLVVATNGGDPKDLNNPSLDSNGTKQYDEATKEIGRDNELINDRGTVKNIYLKSDGTPGADFYQPCVAIPVEDMNISEPAWGWCPREFEAAQEEAAIKGATTYLQFKPDSSNKYEGRYYGGPGNANKTSYDKPLDGYLEHPIAPNLCATARRPTTGLSICSDLPTRNCRGILRRDGSRTRTTTTSTSLIYPSTPIALLILPVSISRRSMGRLALKQTIQILIHRTSSYNGDRG